MKLTKLIRSIIQYTFMGLLSIVLFSCNNSGKKASAEKVENEDIKEEVEEYVYPLVSSFDITTMLNKIEASYIVGIANDPLNVDKYFTTQSKAINLGVYTADLAYATTYNQKLEVQNYFKATQILVGELDLTGAFDSDLPGNIEENLDNKEKLTEIITEISQDAYSFLNRKGQTELSYLILAGSVIEGLYLTTHISDQTFNNPNIIETILYQKEPLKKLAKMMEVYKDSELSASAYMSIVEINEIFAMDESNTAMTETQITKLTQLLDQLRENSIQ